MADTETSEKSQSVDDQGDEDASEAQAQVIASLRVQVTDLFSQVTQLNGKLVASYDRMSDLEDQLHDASSSLRNASLTISSLELERSHHLAALNTGLLVEKAHVTAELNRLMERATEEAAQRGQAESARHDIEKDLDDLSATLFDQANTMVAEARLGQAKSERKVQDAEEALKIAEDAVKDMQVQMQSLQAAKETAERDAREAKIAMGKGKWVERDDVHVGDAPRVRFMTTHTPYSEFIAFVAHLRGLRTSQPTPPVISTLTSQPFIARLLVEDSEPTVRLDLAPSLNWLSRRSVLAAIHTGMLIVEPWTFSSFVQELHQHSQSTSSPSLSCALCGAFIARVPSVSPVSRIQNTNGSSWFKYPLVRGTTQNYNAGTPPAECEPPGQVYIFRLAPATVATPPPSLPIVHSSSTSISAAGASSRSPFHTVPSSRVLQTQTQNSPYPLCSSNYCLTRLRSTCSLWAFVRVGIVERIWEEEVAEPLKPYVNGDSLETFSAQTGVTTESQPASGTTLPSPSERPPVPPRRRKLWEMASALGERAVSWSKESGENNKEKEKEKEKESDSARKLPTPPPSHPTVPHPHAESPIQGDTQVPPPLPKRNIIRSKTSTDSVAPESGSQDEAAASENKELDVHVNSHVNPDKVGSNGHDSSLSVEEDITFAVPPSPPPPLASPISAEPSVPPNEEHATSAPPPHNVPLPVTPTTPNPNPVSRVASPAPRPRSRLSSPASPPPLGSRPASRSRAGSPTPGHHPPAAMSHIRGKASSSSPLAPPRPASPALAAGPGAPPVPRRAAARRGVPPPPSSPASAPAPKEAKADGEGEPPPVASAADDPASEARVSKSEEGGSTGETKAKGEEGTGNPEAASPLVASSDPGTVATTEAAVGPIEGVTAGAAGDVKEQVNGTSETVAVVSDAFAPAPPASEGQLRTSLDTTGTKHSSSTEGEGFAGDTTWEERTWKELVRLKEDMFWARIGGMRMLQGS